MNNAEKTSKVAICEKCQSFVLACDINYLDEATEKEFTDLSNRGFTVKLESKEETRERKYSWWEDCEKGKCNQLKTKKQNNEYRRKKQRLKCHYWQYCVR